MRAQIGNKKMSEDDTLSSYARALTGKDRENYYNKLTLTTGQRLTDPCTITQWEEDMSKWPNIQWPNIYTYWVEKPSVYTREKLGAYKSFDALDMYRTLDIMT